MAKAHHSKHDLKKRLAVFKELTGDSHSSLEQNPTFSAGYELSRHPNGTRAKGLHRILRGKKTVLDSRFRFGEVEERSSRMRRYRRYIHHSARNEARREIEKELRERLP